MRMRTNQKGFTIVELMIATAVFSVVLLICTTGLLQVGRLYYKGITSTQAQETARSIMDEITRAIQFNGGRVQPVSGGAPSFYFCIGDQRYSFILGKQLVQTVVDASDETPRVLVMDSNLACSSGQDLSNPAGLSPSSKELFAPKMRLARLEVISLDTPGNSYDDNLYQVNIRVVSGHKDVLNATKDACAPSRDGTQFCAVSELSTTVLKRVK